jgi:membrane protein
MSAIPQAPKRALHRTLVGPDSSPRRLAAETVRCFEEHDLLTSASAISFQVLTAIVPFLMFAFALLGFLSLGDVWQQQVAPHVRANVSPAMFSVIDSTVTKALASGQLFWMTAGVVLAVWQISGAVRAIMGALNRIYRVDVDRPLRRRMLVSTALAVAVGVALLAAIAVVSGAPLLYGSVGQPAGAAFFILRWSVGGALMLLAVGLLLRYGPARPRPMQWVSFGTVLIVGTWILTSIGFGAYLRFVASYESVFGNLATIVVLMGYIYLSAVVFLAGAQVDALVRRRVES